MLRQLLLLLTIGTIPMFLNAQVGVGASGMYNFQSEGFGAGGRVNLNADDNLSIVPQFSYYFPFNIVHEYTLGLGLEYKFIKLRKYHFDILGHVAYNNWLNYDVSPLEDAKQNNINTEIGAAVSTYGCLRPFLEYRYNVKFRESHVQLGLLYILGCGSGRHKICPAYH